MTQATPAVCEVKLEDGRSCGVLAIGRCSFCGHAFCSTHQARFLQRIYTDTCAPCFPKTEEGKQRCEVDNCGVTAVDHCGICKRAICATHRVFERLPTTAFQPEIYVPRCRPCHDNDPEVIRQAREAKSKEELFVAEEYFRSGAARTALLTAGVLPVQIYGVERRWESKTKGIFRQRVQEEVEVATPIGRGWLLGKFIWHLSWDGGYRECLTAVVDISPDLSPEEYAKFALSPLYLTYLARVQPCSEGYEIVKGSDFLKNSEWKAAAQAVKRLAGLPI